MTLQTGKLIKIAHNAGPGGIHSAGTVEMIHTGNNPELNQGTRVPFMQETQDWMVLGQQVQCFVVKDPNSGHFKAVLEEPVRSPDLEAAE